MATFRALVSFFSIVVAFFTVALSSPIQRRDVWVPKILYPRANIVWKSGFKHNVTWDTSSPPANVTNPTGRIQLRHNGTTSSTVLAEGFNLTDGRHEITVPFVSPGCDYQIVLFGDSGNFSPSFMIASEGD
ncbi:uncharacterized protein FOMMEDRAFT_96332 [Fomitiporia mediterranea MF3/22]|uniref:uncharacterized protein n=1 Tax=Fomitiporia mediterranea (strain MF3/22) TaxID=694068 RepID=UPI00044090F9|nr:uncharacterized protein FOMMEDRAFT_96332 [Fomitiporia mediterranea MF3/22]EJC98531.1 hypothetical protein FOMMEDRAFT_96332 [Fomitiporia mediterranea MF3/22]